VQSTVGHADGASFAARIPGFGLGTKAPGETVVSHAFIRERWIAFGIRAAAILVAAASIFMLADGYSIGARDNFAANACLIFNLVLAISAFGLSFNRRFNSLWQPATFCMAVVFLLNAVTLGIANDQASMLFATLLLAMAFSGALLPWPPLWQAGFNLIALGSWAAVVASGVIEDANSPYRWIGLAVAAALGEITNLIRASETAEHERARRLIANSEAKLRTVFEASPDAIAITRISDGVLLDINPQYEAAASPREELIGCRNTDRDFWDDPEQRSEFFRLLDTRGHVHNMEVAFRTRDGRVLPSLISAVTVELDGEPCVVSLVRSITRLKRTERELVRAREEAMAASHAKSDFLSSMSHEIRTPLHAIIGMTDLLLETDLGEEQRRYLATMADNGNALVELINDILDLARVESGRMALENVPFDLDELIDGVVGTLGVRAHEKGLELAARIAPDVPVALVGDPLRLRQILVNLAGNANKFTEHGQVVLAVQCDPGAGAPGAVALHFSIADTGIGIAPDQLERVFDAFSQADSSTTRKYGGTGLGLAIVKRLADLMQGRVWVESEVGRGSTFHFLVRLQRDPNADHRSSRAEAAGSISGLHALVVDDTGINRVVVREALAAQGARVGEADCGEAALREIARARDAGDPYRLMLVDCRMPGMDGFDLVRQVRESTDDDTVVLMLTSDDLAMQLQRAHGASIANYLVKPIRRRELLGAIGRAMGNQPHAGAPAAPAGAPANHARPLRILLADDSVDNRYLIAAYLKNTPHLIDEVEDGAEAVSRFTESPYDLVLMDIQMPVMDGHEAAAAIRAVERHQGRPHTPIIALTAAALSESIARSFEAGCDEHVSKPVRKAALLEAIRRLTIAPAEQHPIA
jgi:two-component system sensor histidine kinase/response regulator